MIDATVVGQYFLSKNQELTDIQIQKSIANVMNVYILRKKINEQLKAQIKDICPILIRGSLEESK